MSETKVVAKLSFIDGENKKKSLSINNPVPEFNQEMAQQAMEDIIQADAFEVEGVAKYVKKDSAELIETTRTSIFDAKP
ncbi:Protein of unknown function [Granulicatella balaenopterae]|uniref:DUF2922 domain-containing protein n=1 Tax=Granulicatella balaenopterae TaxID=137733 RepID=A0A1H9K3E4_9LACT|nr:DUF2922 domain-containing protein [Granulicatella balaenopterae]SEQ93664.1 Protein of unknown function [Granulicatella balaenopterae]